MVVVSQQEEADPITVQPITYEQNLIATQGRIKARHHTCAMTLVARQIALLIVMACDHQYRIVRGVTSMISCSTRSRNSQFQCKRR